MEAFKSSEVWHMYVQVTNAIAQEILAYTHSHPQWHSPKKIGRRSA